MRSKGLWLVIILAMPISAEVRASDNGLSVMEFLNIGVSARSAGTGEALAALSDGAVSSYYNPAGLTTADNYQITAMHSEWFQDLRYEYLGLAMPTSRRGNFGASFSYLSLGAIDRYSSSNVSTGGIEASDWSLGLAYGHKITERISLGAGAKIVNERLDNLSAYGYAGDIGAQYRSNRVGVGLALMNLGPEVKYEQTSSPLPARVETGLAYWPWGEQLAVLTGVGMPFRGDPSFKAGLEYTYSGALIVRGGFDSAERYDERNGFSMGAGFKINHNSIDYAYNLNSVLGGTHQFSFVIRFGNAREEKFYSNLKDPQLTGPGAVGTPSAVARPQARTDKDKPATKTADRPLYLICAGRYSSRADAEKHMDALEKFGYSPRVEMVGQDDFRVILAKESKRAKAEKKMKEFKAKGISCFIEEK